MPRSLTTHIDSPGELGVRLEGCSRAGRALTAPARVRRLHGRLHLAARGGCPRAVAADGQRARVRLERLGQWLATGVDAAFAEPTDLLEAEVALRIGEVDEAERLYRARSQPGGPVPRGRGVAGLGQIAFRAERFDEAIELLGEALALQRRQDPLRSRALSTRSAVLMHARATVESAIAVFESGVSEARAAEAVVEELRFTILLANALIDNGSHGRCGAVARRRASRLAGELQDPVASARVYWSQSRLHGTRGEPPWLRGTRGARSTSWSAPRTPPMSQWRTTCSRSPRSRRATGRAALEHCWSADARCSAQGAARTRRSDVLDRGGPGARDSG